MKWKAEPIIHNKEARIALRFDYSKEANERVRKLTGVKWSNTLKVWHVADNAVYRKQFGLKEKDPAFITSTFSIDIQQRLKATADKIKLKGYSHQTAKSYGSHLKEYFLAISKKYKPEEVTKGVIEKYLLWRLEKKQTGESDMNSHINAIKFYHEQVLGKGRMLIELPRAKKPHQIPRMFSKEDIEKILKAVENLKHKTILLLSYSSGLRVSEVVKLKVSEIDSHRMVINIKAAKGKKDRIVPLSPTTLKYLREYYKQYKPKVYFFEGQYEGEPYSTRSVQLILAAAKKKAKVNKTGSIHALRHSYATHLLDKGVDITYIQKILGHNDLKTTLRYLHVTNRDLSRIESPLEDLNL
jgi:site-specific recombinase XerD